MQVGKEGLTTAVVRSVEHGFNTREVLKVKVLETAPSTAREVADELAGRIEGTQVVQVMGRIATLYRPRPTK